MNLYSIFSSEALESDDSSDDIVMPSVNATFEHPEHIVTVTTIDDIDLTQDRSSSFRRSMVYRHFPSN